MLLKRSQLQEKVASFQKEAAKVFDAISRDGDDFWDDTPTTEVYSGVEFDGVGEGEDNDESAPPSGAANDRYQTQPLGSRFPGSDDCVNVEHISLDLPSHLGHDRCNTNGFEDLAKAELRLREGQLNDSLHYIRIALGHKSYLFRNEIRPANSQRLKTRAWKGVHSVESTVQHHARVYMLARQAMVKLDADASLLNKYRVLTRQDLSVKTSVIAPHERGQRNKSLAWFWTMDVRRDADVGEWMGDCTCSLFHMRLVI
jgi:hypothetical protein